MNAINLSARQTRKLARFKQARVTNDRHGNPIVVLDEGPKPELTAMCVPALRMTVRDRGNVRHGAITWYAPKYSGFQY